MIKRNYILSFLVILTGLSGFAQSGKYGEKPKKEFTIYINEPNQTIKAKVYAKKTTNLKPNPKYTYYWYALNKISSNQGGFDGRLLHGSYTVSYLNNTLKEQGSFSKGLKSGKWINWHPNGKLNTIANYSAGMLNGNYKYFNENGNQILDANYSGGKLNGLYITYEAGKEKEKKFFKDGLEVPLPEKYTKDKPSFSSKIKTWFSSLKKEDEQAEKSTAPEKKKEPTKPATQNKTEKKKTTFFSNLFKPKKQKESTKKATTSSSTPQ